MKPRKTPKDFEFFCATAEKSFLQKDPCMKDCLGPVKITARAAAIDVTPDDSKSGKSRGVE